MEQKITNIWTNQFRVASFQAGPDEKITIPALFSLLQESAVDHGMHNGYGYYVYKPLNRQWIMTRMSVEIRSRSHWEESFNVITWIKRIKRSFLARDFLITNHKGAVTAIATACYALIDRTTKKPEDLNAIYDKLAPIEGKEAFEGLAAKVPDFEADDERRYITTQYGQVDLNGHISNIKFVEWILDQVSPKILIDKSLRQIDVNYLSELYAQEKIFVSSHWDSEEIFFIKIVREHDLTEICRAKLTWE